MAGVSSEQGSGSLNVELNLVPFIDLLSALVLFLLVTAVWLQVSAIQASVSSKGKSATVQMESEKIQVHVSSSGYRIDWPRSLASRGLPHSMGRDPAKLGFAMRKAVALTPGSLPVTSLFGDDAVPYEDVIAALDAIKSAKVPVGLSTE